jgi:hypothetical protein
MAAPNHKVASQIVVPRGEGGPITVLCEYLRPDRLSAIGERTEAVPSPGGEGQGEGGLPIH